MPYSSPATGSLAVSYPGGSMASGSFLATSLPADEAATGSLSVSNSSALAMFGRARWGTATVSIHGVPLPELVGTVSYSEALDNPIPTASFEVLADYGARYADGSLVWGEYPVTIDLTTGVAPNLLTYRVFEGVTESSSNTGLYKTRASIRCASKAAEWATRTGCIRGTAFMGKRRGEWLRRYAESAGVTITNPDIDQKGGYVYRPVDFLGITVLELIQRWGEIEGWFPRVNPDGSLTILELSSLMEGTPVLDFAPSNYFSVEETPPSKPVTEQVLSGSFVSDRYLTATGTETLSPVIDEGLDENGKPYRTETVVTLSMGAEVLRVTSEWKTVVIPGSTVNPAVFTLAKRTSIASTWEYVNFGDGVLRPTNKLNSRVTSVEEIAGIPCEVAYGWEWTDGTNVLGRFTEQNAKLRLTSKVSEYFEYFAFSADPRSCTLRKQTTVREAYYDPIVKDSLRVYADGSQRSNFWYEWRVIGQEVTEFSYYPENQPPTLTVSSLIYSYVVSLGGNDVYVLSALNRDVYIGNSSGQGYTKTRTEVYFIPGRIIGEAGISHNPPPKIERGEGAFPSPPVGSIHAAQLAQTVYTYTRDASEVLPFKPSEKAEFIEAAESIAELEKVAENRSRIALFDYVAIRSRIFPFLKTGDLVTVTDAARNLSKKKGVVWNVTYSHDQTSGKGSQTTIVAIDSEVY